MGISSSLNAGVTGLSVNSSRLSAIADNIANSGTTGYKRTITDFSSVVTGQIAGKYDAGGVRAQAFKKVDQRGALLSSQNPTDIAIVGRGLIPVTTVTQRDQPATVRPLQFVTTGSFTADEQGFLRTNSGLQLLGWPTDTSGDTGAVIRASQVNLEPVNINGFDFASNPTTRVELGLNLPAGSTGTAGTTFSTGVEYFDAIGGSQTLTLTFDTTANPNEWTMSIADSATTANPISVHTLNFHDTGANAGFLDSVTNVSGDAYVGANGTITLQVNDDAEAITLALGEEDATGFLSQFASDFAPVGINKDGTPVGGLSRVEVDEKGFLEAIYDTGFRQTIYKIPVADVPNLNGLTPLDNQAFEVSGDSGPFFLWDAGDGPTGQMSGFTIEQSATDIAEELTQLITTQRAYSSNAKIITTVDEMLQETTNLKR